MIQLNTEYDLYYMDEKKLREYRNDLVALYIGTWIKPIWYKKRLEEVDRLLKINSKR